MAPGRRAERELRGRGESLVRIQRGPGRGSGLEGRSPEHGAGYAGGQPGTGLRDFARADHGGCADGKRHSRALFRRPYGKGALAKEDRRDQDDRFVEFVQRQHGGIPSGGWGAGGLRKRGGNGQVLRLRGQGAVESFLDPFREASCPGPRADPPRWQGNSDACPALRPAGLGHHQGGLEVAGPGKGVLDPFAGLRLEVRQAGLAGGGGHVRAFDLDPWQVAGGKQCDPDGTRRRAQAAGRACGTARSEATRRPRMQPGREKELISSRAEITIRWPWVRGSPSIRFP